MKKCTICNTEVNDDIKTCPNCGHSFDFNYVRDEEEYKRQFVVSGVYGRPGLSNVFNTSPESNREKFIKGFIEKFSYMSDDEKITFIESNKSKITYFHVKVVLLFLLFALIPFFAALINWFFDNAFSAREIVLIVISVCIVAIGLCYAYLGVKPKCDDILKEYEYLKSKM